MSKPNLQEASTQTDSLEKLRLCMDRGNWQEAEEICSRELGKNRLDARLYYLQALIVEHTGEIEQARDSLKQALYLDRRFALAHYQMGVLCQKAGDVAGAKRCFRNTLGLLEELDDDACIPGAEDVSTRALRGFVLVREANL